MIPCWTASGFALLIAAGENVSSKVPAAQRLAEEALVENLLMIDGAKAEIEIQVLDGGEVVRVRKLATLYRRKDDRSQSFVEFLAPPDVAGTKFLSLENEHENEQYIYLPAFKKVKRIVGSQQKDSSFMGTDFTYSDLGPHKASEYDWKRLASGPIHGEPCHVIEGRPKMKDGTYGRIVLWVHQARRVLLQTELFDKAGELEKRLTVNRLTLQQGRWIATDSVMSSVKRGTATRVLVVALELGVEIPDQALSREALER